MSAAVKLRDDVSADELRVMARESRDSGQCRRLLALAAVAEGRSRAEAAALGGMDRQTLPDWVHRFNAEGMDGLLDRKLGGRPSKLTGEQKAELAAIVEAGPDIEETGLVRWRRVDLTAVIEERFGGGMSARPRVLSSFITLSQNLAPSLCSIHRPRTSLTPSAVMASAT